MANDSKKPINNDLINSIAPSGLKFKDTMVVNGERFTKYFAITKYPSEPEYGWLKDITSIDGVTADIRFMQSDNDPFIEQCNAQIRKNNLEYDTLKNESERITYEKEIKDLTEMIQRIQVEGELVGYVCVILCIQSYSESLLEDIEKKLKGKITSFNGKLRHLSRYQKDAYIATTPYGIPNQDVCDFGDYNMPLSTFLGGYINADEGINDGRGFKIGTSDDGKPIILDTWKRGGDRTNSNWFITGVPGIGKSTFVKLLIAFEYALGVKIIINDPEREYIDYVKTLNGKIISCSGGSGGHINPLQVRRPPKDVEDEDTDDDDESGSDLSLFIPQLRTFFKFYKKNLSEIEIDKLEMILEDTYKRFNIDYDTKVKFLKNEDYPLPVDLYEDILKAHNLENTDITRNLVTYMRSMAYGADAYLWNHYTDIDEDTELIDLDTSSLIEADENIRNAQFHNIDTWVWGRVTRDRKEKIMYIMDEGYLHLDPECPQRAKFIRNFVKRDRKYEASMAFITHSVVDVMADEVKRYGQAIIDGACFKFIMGTDSENLDDTKKILRLTDAEEAFLMKKARGKGILFTGSAKSRTKVTVEVPQKILTMMGSAGGR